MVIDISSKDFTDVATVIVALIESGHTVCVDARKDGDNYESRIRLSAPSWWLSPEAKKLRDELQRKMDEQLCPQCRPTWKDQTAEPHSDGNGLGLW